MQHRQNGRRSALLQWLHRWPGSNDRVQRGATRPCSLGLTIVATSLGFVMVQLDVSILNLALARIGEAVATGITGLQWVVDAYTIAFVSLLLAAGALGDRFGARRVYVSGFVVFVLASLGCGLASGAGALIAARAAQGVGAALMVPCSLALLTMPAAMMARLGRAPSACGRLRQA
jgi:MFS transporter, DHA2 family, methylenomycin A resistance protein